LCWPEVLRPSGKRDLGAFGAVVVVVVVVVIFALGFGLGLDGLDGMGFVLFFWMVGLDRNGLDWIVRVWWFAALCPSNLVIVRQAVRLLERVWNAGNRVEVALIDEDIDEAVYSRDEKERTCRCRGETRN
jgi:hypothetical protein